MAHSGSIIAAGLGRGRINFCNGKSISVSNGKGEKSILIGIDV